MRLCRSPGKLVMRERGGEEILGTYCSLSCKVVKLQETPDAIPEGETPQTVSLNVYQELLDVARPGDRVVVTGIFRANPVRHNSVHRSVRSVYRTYIDAMHFEKEAKRGNDEDDAFLTIFEGGEGKKGEDLWPPERVQLFKVGTHGDGNHAQLCFVFAVAGAPARYL